MLCLDIEGQQRGIIAAVIMLGFYIYKDCQFVMYAKAKKIRSRSGGNVMTWRYSGAENRSQIVQDLRAL